MAFRGVEADKNMVVHAFDLEGRPSRIFEPAQHLRGRYRQLELESGPQDYIIGQRHNGQAYYFLKRYDFGKYWQLLAIPISYQGKVAACIDSESGFAIPAVLPKSPK